MHEQLLRGLNIVERLAVGGRWNRFAKQPFKYVLAVVFIRLYYFFTKKPVKVQCRTFFGTRMELLLPAATDIYLTGGKSHDSEIRLARLMIHRIGTGDQVLDAGAHYGYFSLLAARLTGDNGLVCSFEPAGSSFHILHRNTSNIPSIRAFQKLLAENEEHKILYEFPNRYSEYNSSHIGQYRLQPWFEKTSVQRQSIQCASIDGLVASKDFHPSFIKIDVEGGEFEVLKGAANYLAEAAPMIAMEYVSRKRNNESHRQAAGWLRLLNYVVHTITKEGRLEAVSDIDAYLDQSGLESDNIVFTKISPLNPAP